MRRWRMSSRKRPNLLEMTSSVLSFAKIALATLSPTRYLISAAQKACLNTLRRTRVGRLTITARDGTVHTFGSDSHLSNATSPIEASLIVRNDNFWLRIALFGALGFGEAYMYDEITVPTDLASLMILLTQNRDAYAEMNLLPAGLNAALNNLLLSRIPNTILNAVSNIQAHYDLGNDMFTSFLDPTIMYSCPIWKTVPTGTESLRKDGPEEDPEDTLEQAQYRKVHAMLDMAHIKPGHHILEFGTGWGTLAIEAVRRYPGSKVVSLTLSKEQKILAEDRIAAAGLSNSITVLLCDYRNLKPTDYLPAGKTTFDRIVSIEMLEAVGPENLPVFFAKCNEYLDPKHGVLALQVITMPDARYEAYLRKTDFIQKHIFPGGHCPSVSAIVAAAYKGTRGNLILDDLDNIGPHYAQALRIWRHRFLENFDSVAASAENRDAPYDATFKRKWEFYFAFCEAGFATRTLGDIQVRFTRCENVDLLEGIPL
ncbi:Mycolic acid cyclopropane synthetase-domain-containing protein [Fimicolochytrium jonesii]|uniref:Mycolic acid cyclopropane synthetase-domain-containing protein n=1 Tax=Fimicolochytrium jonesii TaxID=1396493 RepID=UPI0022FE7E7E|nr:Mycolic acid cyclopropane synthetase-domain-containing protein [Fimicolochytrium jonesii]KAI8821449.1 Mycolic acid cyclopropane synthetase-domain-containing protein [Fimicolochytrium jonesii]